MNYDKLEKRWESFWKRENSDRPIMNVYAPKKQSDTIETNRISDYRELWLDTEYQIKNARTNIENTYYLGEAFPAFNPNLGPDFLGAMCGCELRFGADTSWSLPCISDYSSYPPIRFNEDNMWWKKMCELTEAALNDSGGDYLVGITDLHPGADGLVALRGPENAAYDIYDEPEQFKERIEQIFSVFKESSVRLNNIISSRQKGCTNWMGILNPNDFWYVVSCDFSCMISPDCYEEFIIPELMEEIEMLPASMYHLDGPDALKHLDRLLKIDKLNGIQWVYGAGQPSARYWIKELKKIQDAGKCIQVNCEPDDIIPICENLDPGGLNLIVSVKDYETGISLLETAERICSEKRNKIFTL